MADTTDRAPTNEQTVDCLPLSPRRANIHHTEQNEVASPIPTAEKPFQEIKPPSHDEPGAETDTISPQINPEHENAEGACQNLPTQCTDASGPSSLVTGSTSWLPGMSKKAFFFSLCREWRLKRAEQDKSELIGQQFKLSPAVAPDPFQEYLVPLPPD